MNTRWKIGELIEDRWQIHSILPGGMGIVYVVYDYESRAPFAAKTFQDDVFAKHPEIVSRFKKEALTWINLDVHQNVTEALFVRNIEGKLYVFLEYVMGGDLSKWINTPRLTQDLPQALRFAINFCDGMIHALSKGIKAHRDVKPQNCLITYDKTLKLTDFGLAKVFDEVDLPLRPQTMSAEKVGIDLTHANVGLGTPPYMAPEQFDNAREVDVRADVYSFGVMLYEMITGNRLFVASDWTEYEYLHKTGKVPALSGRLGKLNEILELCLAKKPSNRYMGFGQVREDLAAIYRELTHTEVPQPVKGAALSAVRLTNKGASLSELGHEEESLAYYEQALELNPYFETAWYNKGNTLGKVGRRVEAVACLDRALQINPNYAEAWSNKGTALNELGRTEEAINCFDRALEIKPDLATSWYNKGNALGEFGRHEEAVACYERAVEIEPSNASAWYNQASALVKLNRLRDALLCYDRVLEINPHHDRAWTGKGNSHVQLRQMSEALECYEHAIDLDPRDTEAWFRKAGVHCFFGRFDEALICFDRTIENNPEIAQAWTGKGSTLITLGKIEEGLACHDRAIEIDPADSTACAFKGAALGQVGYLDEALILFERALQIDPTNVGALLDKGNVLGGLGRRDEELVCLERAIDINPDFAPAWFNRSVALNELGRPQEALDSCGRALEIDPFYADAWYGKGSVLGNSFQRFREALFCFEKAQRLGHPQAAYAITMCRQVLDER